MDVVTPLILLAVLIAAIPLSGLRLTTLLRRIFPLLIAGVAVAILNTLFAPPVLRLLFRNTPAETATEQRSAPIPQLEAIADLRTGIASAGVGDAINPKSSE